MGTVLNLEREKTKCYFCANCALTERLGGRARRVFLKLYLQQFPRIEETSVISIYLRKGPLMIMFRVKAPGTWLGLIFL